MNVKKIMLMQPIVHPDRFIYADFSDKSQWKEDIEISFNGVRLHDAFSRCSPFEFSYSEGECSETISDYPITRAIKMAHLLDVLGLPERLLEKRNHSEVCLSNDYPIGWGAFDKKFMVC